MDEVWACVAGDNKSFRWAEGSNLFVRKDRTNRDHSTKTIIPKRPGGFPLYISFPSTRTNEPS